MRNGSRIVLIAIVGAMLVAGMASQTWAFPAYTSGCNDANCHGDFRVGDPSRHTMHQQFADCFDCHTSIGTPPDINSSGNYPDFSCNGCHQLEGLVRFHVSNGGDCSPCHSNSPPEISENTVPYYYQEGRTSIQNPCRVLTENGGEDWDGDGAGLDNDGDGLYDGDDPDCAGEVSTVDETWSTLKVLFDLD